MERLKRFQYSLLRIVNRFIPEGSLKDRIRFMVFNVRAFVPKELMINKGECVVEVGTPYTMTAYRLSKCVGGKGRVLIIEPEKGNFDRLNEFVKNNRLTNVTLIQKAAWNKKQSHTLLIASKEDDHKLEQEETIHDNDFRGKYLSKQTVESDVLDNMMNDLGINSVDFITIAVNGAEQFVLEGMKNTLKNTKRIFVKGHARFKRDNIPINKAITFFLESNGFKTKITRPTNSVAEGVWGKRQGDVYAWKSS